MKFLKDIAMFTIASALDACFPRDKPKKTYAVTQDDLKSEIVEAELIEAEYIPPPPPQPIEIVIEPQPINLEDFVKYLNSKVGDESPHRITGKVLEYGMTPQRFLLTVTPENTALFSFFLDCDPTFSAVVFTIAREYFGEDGLIGDSFLYRSDGSICLSGHDDFSAVYIEYIQTILRRARGAASGSKRNTELN